MIKVSVIIPTFNRSKSLVLTLRSILSQTVKPFEIIVSDDGSTDDSKEKINRLGNPKIRWIDAKHTGLPALVRNSGVKISRGDWVAFLDSDDRWEKNKLEEQLRIIGKYNCNVVCTNASRITDNGRNYGSVSPFSGSIISLSDLLKTNFVITSSVLIRKDIVVGAGGFPEDGNLLVGEDYALWLRIAAEADFYFINKPLVKYADNPETSIRKLGKDDYLQRAEVLENFSRYLTKRGSSQSTRFKTYIYKTLLYYSYFESRLKKKVKSLL